MVNLVFIKDKIKLDWIICVFFNIILEKNFLVCWSLIDIVKGFKGVKMCVLSLVF